jgi:hypothetical protein
MATINFTQFNTVSPLTSGDYIVGYKQDGSQEIRATVKQITDLVNATDAQTLSFNESNKNLSISNGNTVSLSALVDSTIDNGVRALSGNWQSTYTTVQNTSAAWNTDNSIDLGVRSLSANWQSTYTTVQNVSTNWNIDNSIDLGVRALSGNWESTYSTVQTNSANWNTDNSIDLGVRTLSGNWESTYSTVQTNSGTWNTGGGIQLSTVTNYLSTNTVIMSAIKFGQANDITLTRSGMDVLNINNASLNIGYNGGQSSLRLTNTNAGVGIAIGGDTTLYRATTNTWRTEDTFLIDDRLGVGTTSPNEKITTTGNISSLGIVYTSGGNSNLWSSVYTTVQNTSGSWGASSSTIDTGVRALTSNWESTYTTVYNTSASWGVTSTVVDLGVRALSGNWESTYTTVYNTSASWGASSSTIDTGVRALTSNWESTYTTVQNTSGSWGGGSGSTIDLGVRALSGNWESTYTTVQSQSATWRPNPKIFSIPVYFDSYTPFDLNNTFWTPLDPMYIGLPSATIHQSTDFTLASVSCSARIIVSQEYGGDTQYRLQVYYSGGDTVSDTTLTPASRSVINTGGPANGATETVATSWVPYSASVTSSFFRLEAQRGSAGQTRIRKAILEFYTVT